MSNLLKKYIYLYGLLLVFLTIASCHYKAKTSTATETKSNSTDVWDSVSGILEQIQAPVFPAKDFVVTNYGAKNDGKTDCSQAFKKAIEDCNRNGGGRVIIPEGTYLCGPIYLKSNVNLHAVKGAKVLFSTNPDDYPLVYTRWEGVELMNYSPLIYAFEEKNIAITGEGVFDGQANENTWWPWKGGARSKKGEPNQNDENKRPALFKMAANNVPVKDRKFGNGFYLRPQFLQPYKCENILIEGVTFTNSPMWNLNPVLCNNVTIQNLKIIGSGPNTDGCDLESCKNVLIKNCFFNTGDDCIAIKSGRNEDGRRINIPSENIIIQGCTMVNGHGGVVIGSEISGGVKNVFAEDCKMNSPLLDRVLRIKSSPERGGITENVYLRNIEVGQVKKEVVIVTMNYKNEKGSYMPVMRNIEVRNLKVANGGEMGVFLDGDSASPVENFRMINVEINGVKTPYKFVNAKNVDFENVTINGKKMDSVSVN